MSQFHTSLSRRDFMKGLGIVGIGISTAAGTTPIFHDLDELIADTNSTTKRSWWVKEKNFLDPTIEVDWNTLNLNTKIFPYTPVYPVIPDATMFAKFKDADAQGIPGDRLKESMLTQSVMAWFAHLLRMTPTYLDQKFPPFVNQPSDWGAPKYSGTPEENLKLIRAVMHYLGSPQVFAFELDEKMQQFLVGGVKLGDVAIPTKDTKTGMVTLPKTVKYGIIGNIKMNSVVRKYGMKVHDSGPTQGYEPRFSHNSDYVAYADVLNTSYRLQFYLHGLGYTAVHSHDIGIETRMGQLTPPFSTFSGLGEHSRANITCSPEYGLNIRRPVMIFTDLPLAPTPPVDAGIWRFCKTCKQCASTCPSGQLSTADEPYWESETWNGVQLNFTGIRSYKVKYDLAYKLGCPKYCGMCMGMCPFSHVGDSMIHPIVRAMASNSATFNPFFAEMEGTFYPRENANMDDWWNRNLDNWSGDYLIGFPQQAPK